MKLNYLAPVNTSGYGITGLEVLKALIAESVEVSLFPIHRFDVPTPEDAELCQQAIKQAELFDRDADSLRVWHQFSLAEHVGRGRHCGMPIFELDRFRPVELHHMRQQDLLFVNSQWAKQVLVDNGFSADAVHVATLGVNTEIFHLGVKPMPTFSADTTVFCNVGKWEIRKGHDVLRDAFNAAFSPGDNVALILHCHNLAGKTQKEVNALNSEWHRFYDNTPMGRGGHVHHTNGRFHSQQELASFMASADCGVFPARAEGWNLELHEMMAMGKTVIATDYSAHTEFCNNDNAMLIPLPKKEIAHDGVFFHANNPDWQGDPGRWGKFGSDEMSLLVDHMRAVHRKKQEGGREALHNAPGVETGRYYSWSKCAREIIAALS